MKHIRSIGVSCWYCSMPLSESWQIPFQAHADSYTVIIYPNCAEDRGVEVRTNFKEIAQHMETHDERE